MDHWALWGVRYIHLKKWGWNTSGSSNIYQIPFLGGGKKHCAHKYFHKEVQSWLPFSKHRMNMWKIQFLVWMRRAKFMFEVICWESGKGAELWRMCSNEIGKCGWEVTSGTWGTWFHHQVLWTLRSLVWDPGCRCHSVWLLIVGPWTCQSLFTIYYAILIKHFPFYNCPSP